MEWQKNGVDWTEGLCLDPRGNFIGSRKRMRKDEEGSGSSGLDGSADVISVPATRNHGWLCLLPLALRDAEQLQYCRFLQEASVLGEPKTCTRNHRTSRRSCTGHNQVSQCL